MPEQIIVLLRYSHIAAGFTGLIAFWVSIFAKKGGPVHIRAGRIFEWLGYYVATTALFACARNFWLYTSTLIYESPSAEHVAEIHYVQFFVCLLAMLAVLFLSGLRSGVRVVRTRKTGNYANWEARMWLYLSPLAGIGLAAFSLWRLGGSGFTATYHWVSFGVGMVPILEFGKERRFFLQPAATKMAWWYRHMDCMLGVGVAFHTAGMVFTTRMLTKWLGFGLEGPWQLIPWLLPSVIGVPVAHFWVKSYRRKFGEDGADANEASLGAVKA